jgi:large subunit ribosomal protein L2
MKLITLKPTTNGTRHQIRIQKNLLSKDNKIIKSTLKGIKNQSGRSSSTGRITIRHQGGGCKNLFRKINFDNEKYLGIVIAIMYDPMRSAFISLNYNFLSKTFFNTLSTEHVTAGALISCDSVNLDLRLGYRTIIKNVPAGSIIHSLCTGSNTNYIRSAGTFGQVLQKDSNNCKIKLPSGQIIETSVNSFCTLGTVSNAQHNLTYIGKAGINRLKGKRPSVRGVAMNPVDHPHGGRTNGGRPSVTPWGIPTKGKPTVLKRK